MKFNINDYKGKYVMHCKTREEAIDFLEYLHSVGRRWCGDGSYLHHTNWDDYNVATAYYFNKGTYSSINYAQDNGYTILEWSDFMNKEFTKADLKTGDIILRKNGNIEIVNRELGMLICENGGWNDLDDIKEDLTSGYPAENYNVVEVRRPKNKCDCCFNAMRDRDRRGTLVYERKEVEEMTLEEVCELLGKEIKIVKRG